MNILFVSTVHPSAALPTMGTFNRVLLDALRAEGHDVRALVPVSWFRSGWSLRVPGSHVHAFRWWYLPRISPERLHRSLSRQLRAYWGKHFSGWTPDVVVGYWVDPDGTAALELAERLGVPGVLLVGGTDVNELAGTTSRGRTIISTMLRAHTVITVGNALASRAADLGVPVERLRVFHRGVDASFHPGDQNAARIKLQIPVNQSMMVWVGRMVTVKGLDTLLDALALVRQPESPHVYLIGGGPLEKALRRQAARLGLSAQVHFVGRVEHHQLPDWYRAADLAVLPSRSEGTPNVLLESLACGTPFVSTKVGSIPELAESPEWLVPPDDPTALAAALGLLLGSRPQVTRITTDDRVAARQFAGVLAETVASFASDTGHPSR